MRGRHYWERSLQIMMKINHYKIFIFFYYSQIQLVLIAAVLTATTSSVLLGQISWESSAIVGISTFFTYSIDNLIDWGKDTTQDPKIIELLPIYRLLCYVLLPLCTLIIVVLFINSPAGFRIALLLLGISTMMAVIRLPKINSLAKSSSLKITIMNRLLISCVWTIVCVFTPIWYTESSATRPQVWMTFAYLWQLMFISAVLWKMEKDKIDFQNNRFQKTKISRILKFITITTIVLTIVDVALGYFPSHNLVVLLVPAATFGVLSYWESSKTSLKIIFTILTLSQISLSVLSAIIHLR